MLKRDMSLAFLILFFAAGVLRAQFASAPAVLQTSYVTTDPTGMKVKISFSEQKGRLTVHEDWSSGKEQTIEILYQELTDVSPVALQGNKWSVMLWQKNLGIKYIPFNSKEDAASVAKYLAELSGLGSAHAQSGGTSPPPPSEPPVEATRRQIVCPQGTQASCALFNNLLEHNDPEIVGYMHPKNTNARVYACFSTEGGTKFFVIWYGNSPKSQRDTSFFIAAFENGVQSDNEFANLRWTSDTFAAISPLLKGQDQGGSVTDSELNYSRSFTNLGGGQTKYFLAIRPSTGRYVERYSFPDKKGDLQLTTYTGTCVQLN